MPLGDIYEVVHAAAVSGQRVVNVWHFEETEVCTDPIPAKSLTAMVEEEFLPTIYLALSIEAVAQCLYARRVAPTTHIPYLRPLVAIVGAISDDAIPSNAAAVMSMYSNEPGRSGRGRMYLSGIPENGTVDGLIDDAEMLLLADIAALFANVGFNPPSPDDGAWKPVIWSEKNSEAHDIVISQFSPSPGSMRSRRLPYGMVP